MNYGQDKFFNGEKGLYTTLISDLMEKYTSSNNLQKDVQVDSFWNESMARLLELLNQKIDPTGTRNYESSGLLIELADGTIDDSVLRAALETTDSNGKYAAIRIVDIMDADAGANFCGEDNVYDYMRFYSQLDIKSDTSESHGRDVLIKLVRGMSGETSFGVLEKMQAGEQVTLAEFTIFTRGIVSGTDELTDEPFNPTPAMLDLHYEVKASKFDTYKVVQKPWVIPWFNLDMESYSKVRGEDKKLSVLSDPKDLGFTRLPKTALVGDVDFRNQAMAQYQILVDIGMEKFNAELNFRKLSYELDYHDHNFDSIDMDKRQLYTKDGNTYAAMPGYFTINLNDIMPASYSSSVFVDKYMVICYSKLEQTEGIYPTELTAQECEQYFTDLVTNIFENHQLISIYDLELQIITDDKVFGRKLLAQAKVVDEDGLVDNDPKDLVDCIEYCGRYGTIQRMEKDAEKLAKQVGVSMQELEDMSFDDFCVLWAKNSFRWIRLIMPQNKRNVEVEDLNRNFWVIAQVLVGIGVYLFDGDGPVNKFLEGIIKELGQIWENVIYLWIAQAVLPEKPFISDTHFEVLMPSTQEYVTDISYSKFVGTPQLDYLIQKYPNKNLVVLPYIRKNNYEKDFYSIAEFPGLYIYDRNLNNPAWELHPFNGDGITINLNDYNDYLYGLGVKPNMCYNSIPYDIQVAVEQSDYYVTFYPLSDATSLGIDLNRYYGLARDEISFEGSLYKQVDGYWERDLEAEVEIKLYDVARYIATNVKKYIFDYKGVYQNDAFQTEKYKTILTEEQKDPVSPTIKNITKAFYQGELLSSYVDVDIPAYSVKVLGTIKTEPTYYTVSELRNNYATSEASGYADLRENDAGALESYCALCVALSQSPEEFINQYYYPIRDLFKDEEVICAFNSSHQPEKTTREDLGYYVNSEIVKVYPAFSDFLKEIQNKCGGKGYIPPYALTFVEGEKDAHYSTRSPYGDDIDKNTTFYQPNSTVPSRYFKNNNGSFLNLNAMLYNDSLNIAEAYPQHTQIGETTANFANGGYFPVKNSNGDYYSGHGEGRYIKLEDVKNLEIGDLDPTIRTGVGGAQREQWLTCCLKTDEEVDDDNWLIVKIEAPYTTDSKFTGDTKTVEKSCFGGLRDKKEFHAQLARILCVNYVKEHNYPTYSEIMLYIKSIFNEHEIDLYDDSWYIDQIAICEGENDGLSISEWEVPFDGWYNDQNDLYTNDQDWNDKVTAWLRNQNITPQIYSCFGIDEWTGERIYIHGAMVSKILVYMFGPDSLYGQKAYTRNADAEFDTIYTNNNFDDVDTTRADYKVMVNTYPSKNFEKYKDFGYKTNSEYYDPETVDDMIEGPSWYSQHIEWNDPNQPWDITR